jgi:Flp pilus assembly protein TadD
MERNFQGFETDKKGRMWRESEEKNPKVMDMNILKGETLFNEGKFDEAETVFLDVLKIDEQNTRTVNNYACLLWQTNQFEKAAEQFQKALELSPDDRDVVWNVGQFFLTIGCLDEVKEIYRSYLAKHPEEKEIEQMLEKVNELDNVEAVQAP